MAYEIKELSVGGILDQAIQIMKDNFGLLFSIAAVALLPISILTNYLTPQFTWDFSPEGMAAWQRASQEAQIYTLPLSLFAAYVVYPATNAAVIWAVAKRYLGEPTSLGAAFGRAFRMFFPLILTNIIFSIVLGFGFLLCFVPGLIFAIWFCLCNHVVVIEGKWGPKSLSRSKSLVQGSAGTIVVLFFMVFVLQLIVTGAAAVAGQGVIQAILSGFVGCLLVVFYSAVGVVLYFSCRCKTENFDLNILADSVVEQST